MTTNTNPGDPGDLTLQEAVLRLRLAHHHQNNADTVRVSRRDLALVLDRLGEILTKGGQ